MIERELALYAVPPAEFIAARDALSRAESSEPALQQAGVRLVTPA